MSGFDHSPTVGDFLETVYRSGSGYVHLSTLNSQIAAVECAQVGTLADLIDGRTDVYLSAAVIGSEKGSGQGGRIVDGDACQLTTLWVELDRAGEPGHKTTGNLWTRDDLKSLREWLPILPTAVVDSGGGWWLYYTLAEPVPLNGDGSGELLLARWAQWWAQIGEQFDRQVDSVFNPGRIVRAPGSINGKEGLVRPAVLKALDSDRVYTVDRLDIILPAPEPPRSAGGLVVGDGDRPGDVFNRDATVAGQVALLESHGFHTPRQLPSGRVDLTRQGKHARDGHSVTVWPDAAVTFWSSAPEALPGTVTLKDRFGASGTYDPFGLYVAVEHDGDFNAAAKALNHDDRKPAPADSPAKAAGGTLADLLGKELEAVRFVIVGLIPEGLTFLAGKPKLGKSWLALLLALEICAGRNVLGHSTVSGEVLYIALEDGERRMQSRVRTLDGHTLSAEALERFHYRTWWPTLTQGGLDQLEQWMLDHPNTRLVVVDTYGKVRGELPGKDRYSEEYVLLGSLQTFATKHRVALVLVHHLRKQGADDWLEQLSGSQAVTGTADTLLGLFRERGLMDATLRLVSRDLDEKDLALKFDGGRWESMGDAGLYRTTQERFAVLQALDDLGGEGKVSDIASLVEKSTANTSKLLTGLEREGMVEKAKYGVYSLKGTGKVVEPPPTTSTTSTTSTGGVMEGVLATEKPPCSECGFASPRHSAACPLNPDRLTLYDAETDEIAP